MINACHCDPFFCRFQDRESLRQKLEAELVAMGTRDEQLNSPCNFIEGVINFHVPPNNGAIAPTVPTFMVTGGCTLVKGKAMAVRMSFRSMMCCVSLQNDKHTFWYHGEDVGWSLNMMREGLTPHVLTSHLVKHIAAHKAPTDIVPLKQRWPIDLTGRRFSLPAVKC